MHRTWCQGLELCVLCRGKYKAIKRKLNQNCAFHLCPRSFTAAVVLSALLGFYQGMLV